MNLGYLIDYLDAFLEKHLFKDYCENGLQFGDRSQPIKIIAVGVTADLATIKSAAEIKADVLITHHGIFWNGDPQKIVGYKKNRVSALLQAKMSLVSYHLPLDAHKEIGNNWKVAHDLNWSNLEPFGSNQPQLGVGGKFPSISLDEFISILTNYYETSVKAIVPGGNRIITSASLIAGNGYRDIEASANAGYDCHITGAFDEPAWSLAQETKVNFLAFGHTSTEKIGPIALVEHLKKTFNLDVRFIDTGNIF